MNVLISKTSLKPQQLLYINFRYGNTFVTRTEKTNAFQDQFSKIIVSQVVPVLINDYALLIIDAVVH